jgi:hypothetical protein
MNALLPLLLILAAEPEVKNRVQNSQVTEVDGQLPRHFELTGAAAWRARGRTEEVAMPFVVLDSAGANSSGAVSQKISGIDARTNRWYRFEIMGLPEPNFLVGNDGLFLKVEYFSKNGTTPLDGIVQSIYPQVLAARKNLDVNGNLNKLGSVVWTRYAVDFQLPFPEIDTLKVTVGFKQGQGNGQQYAGFFATDFCLKSIADPATRMAVKPNKIDVTPLDLTPLGGHWFVQGTSTDRPTNFTTENAHRLFYRDDRYSNPFAENTTAWLRKGYLDKAGKLVDQDRFVSDNVIVRFDENYMYVQAKNLPNHPTANFPGTQGPGGWNPHYIQEQNATYRIPLNPKKNPNAIAMNKNNSNRALPMGAIGIAVNGVIFFNPFDAGSEDAHDVMDRCCGHAGPQNMYHYHKYPVCVKSPFADTGEEHSPLIGWAFDGYPIYGPYESKGVMAKDLKENPLNEFNIHFDEVRGWHYHVTPGKFPYVIGGYWGEATRGRAGGPPKK